MFLNDLTENEKQAFVGLAKQLVMADGMLNKEEEVLLAQMLNEMQLPENTSAESTEISELAHAFTSQKSKTICIIELVALGYANMEYHTLEKDFINNLAEHFNISLEKTIEIENWVVKQLAHLYEAEELWLETSVED